MKTIDVLKMAIDLTPNRHDRLKAYLSAASHTIERLAHH